MTALCKSTSKKIYQLSQTLCEPSCQNIILSCPCSVHHRLSGRHLILSSLLSKDFWLYIDDVGVTVSLASGNCPVDRTLKSDYHLLAMTLPAGHGLVWHMLQVWLCGGRLVHLACSKLGHIARPQPYTFPDGRYDTEIHNYKRAIEVWMGPYKKLVYEHHPKMKVCVLLRLVDWLIVHRYLYVDIYENVCVNATQRWWYWHCYFLVLMLFA